MLDMKEVSVQTCPAVYPWLGNVYGKETEEKDVYPKYEEEN